MTGRSYSAHPENTPSVSYIYDNQTLPQGAPSFVPGSSIGRLIALTYGSSSNGNYMAYDQFGRVTKSFQQTDGVNYELSYSYDLAGNLRSEVYPSGKTYKTDYDEAGRISEVSRYNGQTLDKTYASAVAYTAHGGVTSMELSGGAMKETMSYNSRLQPTTIEVRKSAGNVLLLGLDYGYGTSANNGNVLTQAIRIPNGTQTLTISQSYTYDSLNRLKSATETGGWSQTYDYDRWGNRWVTASSGYTPDATLCPRQQSHISTTTNRITMAGFGYDASGNQTAQTRNNQSETLGYDAENRMVRFVSGGATTSYEYDGDGRRVKRTAGTQATVFVYNAMGQMVAEYGQPQGSGGTRYLTTDHLGSTRLVTDAQGAVKARYDYLPFGEELGAGIGGRTTAMKYDALDSTRQRFTSKERDSESGLDYFGARYYSSAQGRFTSADPLFLELRRLPDPQQLNLYGYTRNNPLKFIDPLGLDITVTGTEQEEYRKRLQANLSFQVSLNKQSKVVIVDAKGKELGKKELEKLGKTLTGGEKELFSAITDKDNHVTIDTGDGKANADVFFGRFDGNGKNTLDFADLRLLDAPENKGGITAEQIVAHETLEAYASAVTSSTSPAAPHSYANRFFGGLGGPIGLGTPIYDSTRSNLVGVTGEYPVVGKSGVNAKITMHFVTPIPASAIPTTPTGSQKVNVVKVEKTP